MASSTKSASSLPPIVARLRASALIALPFQVASVALALLLVPVGWEVELPLTFLLIPVYWVPLFVELVFRIQMPWPLQVSYLAFIAAGSFAGSALHVYWYFPLWDVLVHFYSGIMLAWLGLFIVRHGEEQTDAPLPRWFSLTVVLLTPVAFAAVWEIFEFGSDMILGTAAQHGLSDSMTDIVAGTVGGIFAIILLFVTRRPRSLAPASLLARR
jgi:hypothetical protein